MMGFVNSGYRWFLVLVLSAGFCLGLAVSADADLIPEQVLLETTFNVDRWKRQIERVGVTVYYGPDPLLSVAEFTYDGTNYQVYSISSAYPTNKVKIGISPKFPPAGSTRSDFSLYLGSTGHELKKFNFGDTSNNEWSGDAGFRQGYIDNDDRTKNGHIKITLIDTAFTDNLEFSESRPTPDTNSDGKNIGGRLVVVGENSDGDEINWRICNRGFGVEEAKVACRQMGLPTGGAKVMDLSKTGWLVNNETGWAGFVTFFELLAIYWSPALLDKIECTGSENKLYQCKHLGLGVLAEGSCPIENTAAVRCLAKAPAVVPQCPCGYDLYNGKKRCRPAQYCDE